MKRVLWIIGKTFSLGVQMLNTAFCEEDNEKELSDDDKWLIAEQINGSCSKMMIEDANDILTMINSIPANRLCERTDCLYHHPDQPLSHNYTYFQDKCNECLENENSKEEKDNRIDHFESK